MLHFIAVYRWRSLRNHALYSLYINLNVQQSATSHICVLPTLKGPPFADCLEGVDWEHAYHKGEAPRGKREDPSSIIYYVGPSRVTAGGGSPVLVPSTRGTSRPKSMAGAEPCCRLVCKVETMCSRNDFH